MNETWKDVIGYEGSYMVSTLGRIKSTDRFNIYQRKGKVLNQTDDGRGYLRVFLSKEGIVKTIQSHRIVAAAFIPNPENKPHINHINGEHADNRIENLEWCTHSENMLHSYRTLNRKAPFRKFGAQNPAAKSIVCIETDETFATATEAAQKLNVPFEKIGMVCRGQRKSTGGLSFRYA